MCSCRIKLNSIFDNVITDLMESRRDEPRKLYCWVKSKYYTACMMEGRGVEIDCGNIDALSDGINRTWFKGDTLDTSVPQVIHDLDGFLSGGKKRKHCWQNVKHRVQPIQIRTIHDIEGMAVPSSSLCADGINKIWESATNKRRYGHIRGDRHRGSIEEGGRSTKGKG